MTGDAAVGFPGTPHLLHWMAASGLWFTMMVVMMFPSVAPWLRGMVVITEPRSGRPVYHAGAFGLGYAFVWLTFSMTVALIQLLLQIGFSYDPTARLTLTSLPTGWMLLLAGVYQFSPIRQACLRHCRSPMTHLLTHWRPGAWMSVRTGLLHGVFCVGCCWVLMLVGLAAGVMNITWLVFVTLVIAVEKLAPHGEPVARGMAAVYMAWGLAVLLI